MHHCLLEHYGFGQSQSLLPSQLAPGGLCLHGSLRRGGLLSCPGRRGLVLRLGQPPEDRQQGVRAGSPLGLGDSDTLGLCMGLGDRATLLKLAFSSRDFSGAWGSRCAEDLLTKVKVRVCCLPKQQLQFLGERPFSGYSRSCPLPCLPCLYHCDHFCGRAIEANGRAVVPVPGPMDPDPKGALLP